MTMKAVDIPKQKRKLIGVQFIRELRIFGVPRGSIGASSEAISLAYDDSTGSIVVTRDEDGATEQVLPSAVAVLSWRLNNG